jgi:HlyD family secretion protein
MKIREKAGVLWGRIRGRKSVKFIVIGVVAVAVAVVGVIELTGSRAAGAGVTYEVVSLTTGTLQKTVSGSGTLQSGSDTAVLAPVDLGVTSVAAGAGDSVKAGDVIANIDASTLASSISALRSEIKSLDRTINSLSADSDSYDIITSTLAGRVKAVYAKAGDSPGTVQAQNGGLLVISTDGRLKFSFTAEKETALSAGDTVSVSVADDGTYTGTVRKVSADKKTITVTVTDNGPKVGAKATAKLDGKTLGSGKLSISSPAAVTASGGTVSKVYVEENDKVYSGTSLVKVTGLPDSEEYQSTVSQRAAKAELLVYAQQIQEAGAIVAPSDGIITAMALQENATARSGASMFTLSSTGTLAMTVAVDELDINSVAVGQAATVSVDAVTGKTYNATVKSISQVGTSSNGVTTYDVSLTLTDADDTLRIGMNATATIVIEEATDALMVPLAALQSQGGEQYVYVYTGSLPGDTSQDPGTKTTVTTGLSNDAYAEVQSGLTADDKVVVVTVASSDSESSESAGMNFGGLSGMSGGMGGRMMNQGGSPPDMGGDSGGGNSGGSAPGN